MLRLCAFIAIILVLSACGEPRDPILTVDQVKKDRRQCDLRIVQVFDCLKVARPTETSHLIEVDVLDGASDLIGKHITLPYDEWMVGKPPPKVGERMKIAPADWVQKAVDSKGEPMGGWKHQSEIK
jgi:hypothetical protein